MLCGINRTGKNSSRKLSEVLLPKYCDFKTESSANLGMFHCPTCGEMVIGGTKHPTYILTYEIKTNRNSLFAEINSGGK